MYYLKKRVKLYNGQTFTQVVNQVAHELMGQAEAEREISLFGAPRECYGDVYRATTRRLAEILEQAQLTVDEYNDELETRTTPKFAYWSGLSLDPFDQGLRWELH